MTGNGGTDTANIDDHSHAGADNVTVTGTQVTGDGTYFGAGGSVSYAGLANLNVSLGTGANVANIQGTGAATVVTGGTTSDTYNVGANGDTRGIVNSLSLVGSGGTDTANVDDHNHGTADTVAITGTQITGSGTYFGTGGSLTYSGMTSLNVKLGTGVNTANVQSTSVTTAVTGGTNTDTFNVGNSGDTHGIVNSLTLTGNGGTDTANVDDSSHVGADTVTITSTQVSGNGTFFGAGGSLTYAALATLNIKLGTGADTANIQSTGAATTVTGGASADIFNVGNSGDTHAINNNVSLTGNGGSDTTNVDDHGHVGADSVTITSTQVTGDGTFFGAGGSLSYTGMANLNVQLSTGADTANILSTGAATSVTGGASADTFNVGNSGDTHGVVNSLTLTGNGGADTANVDDHSHVGADTVTITGTLVSGDGTYFGAGGSLTYAGLAILNVKLGTGAGVANIQSTGATTNVTGGVSADTFNVGNSGDTHGIINPLSLTGNGGADTANIDDHSHVGADTVTITGTQVTGDSTFFGVGGSLGYTGLANLNVKLGTGSDSANILSTSAATAVTGGASADTFNVGNSGDTHGIVSGLTLTGNGGVDTANVDDHSHVGADTVTITATQVTGDNTFFGPGGSLTYAGMANLNVKMGTGAGTANIQSTSAVTAVTGGTSADIFNVSNSGDTHGIVSNLTLTGNGGADVANVDDHAHVGPDTATITGTQVTGDNTFFGPGGSLTYAGMANLNVKLGTGAGTANIQSTGAITAVTGGASADIFNVGASGDTHGIVNGLTLTGNGGADTANVDDHSHAGADTVTITGTQVTGDNTYFGAGGGLTYTGLANLNVKLGTGTGTASILSTGAATAVTGGASADTFNVGNGGDTHGIVNSLSLTGNGGVDTSNIDDHNHVGADTVTITGTQVTGDNTFFGPGGSTTYAGLTNLNVKLGTGADVANIQATGATTAVTGGASADIFNVGNSGDTHGIVNSLTLTGNGGADTANVDDHSHVGADTVTITGTQVTGDNTYFGPGGSLTYGGLANLNVKLGTGAGTANIQSTGATTNVTGGVSADIFNVGNSGDTHNIVNTLSLTGNGGADVANTDDHSHVGADTVTITSTQVTGDNTYFGPGGSLTYAGLATLNVSLGTGADTANIQSTAAATAVTGGTSADIFNVFSSGDTSGIVNNLSLTGNGGADTANVDDHSHVGADTVTITATQVTGDSTFFGPGGSLTYAGLANLNVKLGTGADTAIVQSTSAVTVVTGGASADIFNVGNSGDTHGIVSSLTLTGNGGADTSNVDDHNHAGADSVTITGTQVTGAGTYFGAGGSLTYAGMSNLNVLLGTGASTANILSTSAVTAVTGGVSADTFNVGGGNTHNIVSGLTITGNGGADTANVDDSAYILGADTVTITGTQVTGPNTYFGAGGILTYGGLTSLNVKTGSGGADTVNLVAAGANTTATGGTTDTTFNVLSYAAGKNVNLVGQTGNDLFNIFQSLPGGTSLNIEGGDHNLAANPLGNKLVIVPSVAIQPVPTTGAVAGVVTSYAHIDGIITNALQVTSGTPTAPPPSQTLGGAVSLVNIGTFFGFSENITFATDLVNTLNQTQELKPGTAGATVTITGGANKVTIDGNGNRVFQIDDGAIVELDALTIQNGSAVAGGGILDNGTLTIKQSTFTGNSAGTGGALEIDSSSGTVVTTIINSTFYGNSSVNSGGADQHHGRHREPYQ